MITADEMDRFTDRIIEFLNAGNLYGARAFLGFFITASETQGNLEGGDKFDWRAMYDQEVKSGIVPDVLAKPSSPK